MARSAVDALRDWLVFGQAPRPQTAEAAAELVRAAAAQGLSGLLHEAAPSAGWPWPDHVLSRLRMAALGDLARGERQMESAARGLGALAAAGIRALPLKGAAVAESLYDSLAERPMADVDLLLLDHPRRALDVLRQGGHRLDEEGDHAWALVEPWSGIRLELHHALASCPGTFPVEAEGLWQRSRPGHGRVPRLPSPEDLLVHLSVHAAFQHGLALRLVQYLDVRRLLERTPPAEDALLSRAREASAEAAVALTLRAAAALVGAPALPGVQAALEAAIGWPVRRRCVRLSRKPLSLLQCTPLRLFRVRWALADGRRRRFLGHTFRRRVAALAPVPP